MAASVISISRCRLEQLVLGECLYNICSYAHIQEQVAESIEQRFLMWMVRNLNSSCIKPMTYKIDTYRYLDWQLALLGYSKDWLDQYHHNVIE